MPAPTLNLQSIELESTLRPFGANGAPGSADYNDSEKEKLRDLATITETFNAFILPLLNALSADASLPPTGAIGIQGSTVFTDTTDLTSLFFDVLNDVPLTIAQSLRIQNGQISNIATQVNNLAVQVQSLSTSLSSTGQNDVASAISGIYSVLATLESQLNSIQQSSGNNTQMLKNMQSRTVQTAEIFPDAVDTVPIIWGSAFPDNTYSVSYAINEDTGNLQIQSFSYMPNGTGITVRVKNNDPVNTLQGNVCVSGRISG